MSPENQYAKREKGLLEYDIDELDLRIYACLVRRDGDLWGSEIGRRVGVGRMYVLRRAKKLCEVGFVEEVSKSSDHKKHKRFFQAIPPRTAGQKVENAEQVELGRIHSAEKILERPAAELYKRSGEALSLLGFEEHCARVYASMLPAGKQVSARDIGRRTGICPSAVLYSLLKLAVDGVMEKRSPVGRYDDIRAKPPEVVIRELVKKRELELEGKSHFLRRVLKELETESERLK